MGTTIKGVTFDLWDTMIDDDSDEPRRAALGLRSKRQERRHLLWAALDKESPIDQAEVADACDHADAAFTVAWKQQAVTWPVATRLGVALRRLGRRLSEAEFAAVVVAHEEMEVAVPPDPVAGIAEALDRLAGRYRLGVASDTIVSPGRCLKRLLEGHGLARYFSGFAFSDQVGHAKPHRAMFESVARQMGCEIAELVHVGDREHNDVKGPRALGMKAVLFTGVRDADLGATTADAVCARHADLPDLIDRLAGCASDG